MMKRVFSLWVVMIWVMVVSGCAVKPQPLSEEEHWQAAMADKASLYEGQPPLTGPLTLSMAIARALTYNYDNRLAMLEGVFQESELTVANLGMLPKITANAGYSMRNNESASRSISYFKRTETLEPSVSQERQHTIADLSFNWSALDFGLSYFQAKQSADRYLIAQEKRRRVMNNIIKDVIVSFWRVAVSDMMEPQVKEALRQTEQAIANYQKARQTGLEPMLATLDAEKKLLQIAQGLKRVAADMAQARPQLATLINIPPSQPFKIQPPDMKVFGRPAPLPTNLTELEDLGLYLRPDLREEIYQGRIEKAEVHKEIIRMIPGLSLVGATNYDSNKFMYHSVWSEATTRVSTNLLGLIANYNQYKSAEAKVEVAKMRRMATMVAALVQIHLAHHQYALALDEYRDNQKMTSVERRIFEVITHESDIGSLSDLDRVDRYTNLIAARLSELHSLTLVHEAWGNLYFSIGGDIIDDLPENVSLEEKAALIQASLDRWLSGRLPEKPILTGPEPEQTSPEAVPAKFKEKQARRGGK